LELLDELLKPKNPMVVSYMNSILEDIDGAINDDEEVGGLKNIAYPLPVHPRWMEALEILKDYGIVYETVFDEENNQYIQLSW
jgi:hypothetical protein